MAVDGLIIDERGTARCYWCGASADYREYHDREWGFPVGDDRRLFEKICLEGFQAGLSWLTILRKREAFREAFVDFDLERLARFGAPETRALLKNPAIVRHRGKIESTINNARRALVLAEEFGSLAAFFWRYEPAPARRPRRITRRVLRQLTTSAEAKAMARELKRRGWTYVGPTTAYALMQAMGLVNDHIEGCAVRQQVAAARRRFKAPV